MFPMGVGFPAMMVTTVGEPSLLVLVRVWVTIEGVLVMVEPALFVVVTKTVDCNVVLCEYAQGCQRHTSLPTSIHDLRDSDSGGDRGGGRGCSVGDRVRHSATGRR